MEMDGHKHLLHQTIYHVNKWHTAHLTAKHLCEHIYNGLTPDHLKLDRPDDEDTPILSIPFQVTWKPTWVPEDTVLTTPSGTTTINNYTNTKTSTRKKSRTSPPTPPTQPKGWNPKHTTFTTRPINPDLNSAPTGSLEVTRHPKNNKEILLHAPDGRFITTFTKAILQKLYSLYNHANNKPTLPEALAELTHIHTIINITHDQTIETKLHKHYKPQPQQDLNGTWPIPDIVYDALDKCFKIRRNPLQPNQPPPPLQDLHLPRPKGRMLRSSPLHQNGFAGNLPCSARIQTRQTQIGLGAGPIQRPRT